MLITDFRHEYALLRAALAEADPKAPVPSCPEWTAADLEEHVAAVYLHKVEVLRNGAFPKPWPPADGVGALDDAFVALAAEFAARAPEDASVTWFDPDQTVGFWMRRMALETAIHRVDAELAAGREISIIDPDLAVNGIDEVLGWITYGSVEWHEDFTDALAKADARPFHLVTASHRWTIAASPERVVVDNSDERGAGVIVNGTPDALYRWIWGRTDEVRVEGDESMIPQFRAIMAPVL